MTHRDVFSRGGDFQRLDSLKRNRQKRAKTGLVFVEGVRAINCALENRMTFESVVVDGERRLSSWAEQVVRAADAKVIALHKGLMAELSERDEASELLCLVRRPAHRPEAIALHAGLCVVVLDRPGSEGNLGSVIRTADAFGADAVITSGHGVDIFDPKTIRAYLGTIFNLPVMHSRANRRHERARRLVHRRARCASPSVRAIARKRNQRAREIAGRDVHRHGDHSHARLRIVAQHRGRGVDSAARHRAGLAQRLRGERDGNRDPRQLRSTTTLSDRA
ncbi:MAG: TrmH family RNA methyltransferase [Gammaproteobacteria bacterium]